MPKLTTCKFCNFFKTHFTVACWFGPFYSVIVRFNAKV